MVRARGRRPSPRFQATPARPAGVAAPGATGDLRINGEPVHPKAQPVLPPSDRVLLRTPGGGGYGRPPSERDPEAEVRDRALGCLA